jgi:hypothetical protein
MTAARVTGPAGSDLPSGEVVYEGGTMRKQRNVVIGIALLAGMLACPDRPGQPRTGEGGREGSTANKAADRPDDRGATAPRSAETGTSTGSATPGGAGSSGTTGPGATGDSQSAGTTRNTGSSGGTGSGSGGSGSTGSESSGTR